MTIQTNNSNFYEKKFKMNYTKTKFKARPDII